MAAPVSRRHVLGRLLALPVAAVAAACTSEASTASPSTTTAGTATTGAGATATTAAGSAAESTVGGVEGWVSGGTDLLTVDPPPTSLFDTVPSCRVDPTPETTLGPCWFDVDSGDDISAGFEGLPMWLCLRVHDPDCNPLVDHAVEVWHTDVRGFYTGDTTGSADDTSFSSDRCTLEDETALATNAFRGRLTTDADGRVNFRSCFPGWYAGRTIHVHYAVTAPDGTTRSISQLVFTDAFADEICTTHERYADRGLQDTPLADDALFSDEVDEHLFSTARNDDGTLLAFATVVVDPNASVDKSF